MNASESCLEHSPSVVSSTAVYEQLLPTLGRLYCRLFHNAISHPVNGTYRCWTCLREFETGWHSQKAKLSESVNHN
jgi:hypothetical protein